MHKLPVVAFLLSVILLPLMISSESLWVDEGGTASFAQQVTFLDWWNRLAIDHTSDAQMPLYMLFAWLNGKVIGSAEWQLRVGNILWGIVALAGAAFSGRILKLSWLPLLLVIQPYFWSYMNDARPYMLQIGLGSWLLAGLLCFIEEGGSGTKWALILGTTGAVLCYATMLAPLTLFALALVISWIAIRYKWLVERKALIILSTSALIAVPAAFYYLQTLLRGAKGSQLWAVDAKFFLYVIYELSGFIGLGPSVYELRDLVRNEGTRVLLTHSPDFLGSALYGVLLVVLVAFSLRDWPLQKQRKAGYSILAVLLIVSVCFFAGSILLQKALWARHFAPAFAFYVAALALVLSSAANTMNRALFKVITIGFCTLLISSSLGLRFLPRHRKEDYRSASLLAKKTLADQQSVWWVAAPDPAEYYGVPLTFQDAQVGYAFCPQANNANLGKETKQLSELPLPSVIILSRPDAFDTNGTAQCIIKREGYKQIGRVQGFTFFRR
ncbi:hypothetical protein ACXR0O_10500 [Verrucomicrobiota bacterium sgz303538]